MSSREWFYCPICGRPVTANVDGRLRVHGPRNVPCQGSGMQSDDGRWRDHSATDEDETP